MLGGQLDLRVDLPIAETFAIRVREGRPGRRKPTYTGDPNSLPKGVETEIKWEIK